MTRIIFVACVAKKLRGPSRAADLYASAWFIKARQLVEASGDPWFILSAKYGLVKPNQVITPYDETLSNMSKAKRQEWALLVEQQMEQELAPASEAVVLAGMRYREDLMPYLRTRFTNVIVPMMGLSSGRQLNWLSNAHAI